MNTRSWLCVNLFREDHLLNLEMIGADIVHFDFEDSVLPDRKAAARESYHLVFKSGFSLKSALRINSLSTLDGLRDLIFLADCGLIPDFVILPKAQFPEDIELASKILRAARPDVSIFAVIESAKGLLAFSKLAEKPAGLDGVIFGAADFAADLKVNLDDANFDSVRWQIVLTARSLGLTCIDSPFFSLTNVEHFNDSLLFASRLGFDGKIAIHPSQVVAINTTFSPSHEQVDRARRVLEQFASTSTDAVMCLDDVMVGPPFVRQAKHLILKSSGGDK